MVNRRAFLQSSTATVVGGLGAITLPSLFPEAELRAAENALAGSSQMKLSFKPFTLELKHAFGVSVNTRTTTPIVHTTIEYGKHKGYGEASMPPYLGESQETVMKFLAKVDVSKYDNPFQLETILAEVDAIEAGNTAAKASVDIALHDLVGKLIGQPLYNMWGFDKSKTTYTSFTIGIDTPDVVRQKVKEVVNDFGVLKIKLGRDNDKEMIETVRSLTDKPLTADANQGWKDKQYALDMAHYMKEKGFLYIEQPMHKDMVDEHAWLTERSPLPILGDESMKRLSDLVKYKGVYSGIVLKLMKTTGLREAHKMIAVARAFGMKVMIGCMTETSCAITAAAHLTPMVDWADLDGAMLSKNDNFKGMTVNKGKIILPDRPGIGVVPV
ncbi:MAG: dipeptide epimerase [Candidatus Kapaibacterium sp.]|nr:MAG: dipeptide epimerase [Candidatus Kapabacteria bacterium]